jgi:predicted nucleotidyltransferase
MKKEEIISFLAEQKNIFFDKFAVTKLGLFGSAARGENPNDIDVIIEFKPGTQDLFEKKFKIKQILESQLQLPVDICREKFIHPKAKELIMHDAIFV